MYFKLSVENQIIKPDVIDKLNVDFLLLRGSCLRHFLLTMLVKFRFETCTMAETLLFVKCKIYDNQPSQINSMIVYKQQNNVIKPLVDCALRVNIMQPIHH